MEKKQDDVAETKKVFVKKLVQYLTGKADNQMRTQIASHVLLYHEANLKTLSLDDMNEIAKYYLKKAKGVHPSAAAAAPSGPSA